MGPAARMVPNPYPNPNPNPNPNTPVGPAARIVPRVVSGLTTPWVAAASLVTWLGLGLGLGLTTPWLAAASLVTCEA